MIISKEESKMDIVKKEVVVLCILYFIVIACAELILYYTPIMGLLFYDGIFIILLILILISFLFKCAGEVKCFLISLILPPFIRIAILRSPFYTFDILSGFFLIIFLVAVLLFIVIFICLKIQNLHPKDIGVKLSKREHLPLEIGVILAGFLFGIGEYYVLKPNLIIATNSPNLIVVSFVMVFLCMGFVEELTFRGLIQYNAIKMLGKWKGILFVSLVFTALLIGNLAFVDGLIAFIASMLFSYTKEQTGSIYGISVSHGLTNITLFLIMPALNVL